MLEEPSKAPRSFERSEEIYNEGEYPSPKTFKANPISKASLNENFPGMSSQLAGYKGVLLQDTISAFQAELLAAEMAAQFAKHLHQMILK